MPRINYQNGPERYAKIAKNLQPQDIQACNSAKNHF